MNREEILRAKIHHKYLYLKSSIVDKKTYYMSDKSALILDLLEYALLILIVVLTGGIWGRTEYLIAHPSHGWALIWLVAVIASIFRYYRIGFNRMRMSIPWIAFYAVLFVTNVSFGHPMELSSSAVIFIPILVFIFYSFSFKNRYEINTLMTKFIRIMLVICSISLFFFIFGSVLRWIKPSGAVTYEWDVIRNNIDTFFYIYYEPQSIDFFTYSGARNCAIFAEAPMFVFLISLALAYQALVLKRGLVTCSIFAVTILTTFSSTGYVSLLIIILAYGYYIMGKKIKKSGKSFFPAAIISCVLLLLCAVVGVLILKDKASTDSYGVRMDHLLACARVFGDTFPTGLGFGNIDLLTSQFTYKQGPAIGLMYFFALGGVWAVLIFFVPFLYATICAFKRKDIGFIGYLLVYLWLFFTTSLLGTGGFQWLVLSLLCIRYANIEIAPVEKRGKHFSTGSIE